MVLDNKGYSLGEEILYKNEKHIITGFGKWDLRIKGPKGQHKGDDPTHDYDHNGNPIDHIVDESRKTYYVSYSEISKILKNHDSFAVGDWVCIKDSGYGTAPEDKGLVCKIVSTTARPFSSFGYEIEIDRDKVGNNDRYLAKGALRHATHEEIFKAIPAKIQKTQFIDYPVIDYSEYPTSEIAKTDVFDKHSSDWCILRTRKTSRVINEWFIENRYGEPSADIHYICIQDNKKGYRATDNPLPGKRILSFEEFQRLVLETKPASEMRKFKVGDKVVGNSRANGKYSTTSLGWVGVVTSILTNEGCTGRIYVQAKEGEEEFLVEEDCFDLVQILSLKNQAKLKYPIGTKYRCAAHDNVCTIESMYWAESGVPDKVYAEEGKGCLYYNGQWAQIISSPITAGTSTLHTSLTAGPSLNPSSITIVPQASWMGGSDGPSPSLKGIVGYDPYGEQEKSKTIEVELVNLEESVLIDTKINYIASVPRMLEK